MLRNDGGHETWKFGVAEIYLPHVAKITVPAPRPPAKWLRSTCGSLPSSMQALETPCLAASEARGIRLEGS
jgi:hypothetical protein